MKTLSAFLVPVVLAFMACSSTGGGGTDAVTPDPGSTVDPGQPLDPGTGAQDVVIAKPDYGETYVSTVDKAFLESFQQALQTSVDMTADELMEKHYVERPFVDSLGVDATKAEYLDLIDGAYALTDDEMTRLADQGFFLSDRVQWGSHPIGYQEIFDKDLPVLITTDSILFAIHNSYDLMLKKVEQQGLIPALDDILASAHSALGNNDGLILNMEDALSDADLYFTVARSLLKGAPTPPLFADNAPLRDELLQMVEDLKPRQIQLFGRPYPCAGPACAYDFSQFKPRGHYTETEELQRYFKAMIWLGRTELALTRHHRDFVVSWLLLHATDQAKKMDRLESMDQTIRVFVGKSDNLTLPGFAQFLADQGAVAATVTDPTKAVDLMKALESGGYADQKIMSQIMSTNPFTDTPTSLPPIFLFLGQRFVIDSYVFHNVTYDRIVYQGQKIQRLMPSPLDPLFVLGFQETLPLLRPELEQYFYAGNLFILRFLVDSYGDDFWSESMYNVWLDAIRGLAVDTSGTEYPEAVRTKAYALKSLHTGLASWAELRHDTILYVKQSYSGIVCDYPDGYVEPFPAFFRKIADFAQVSGDLFEGLDMPELSYMKTSVGQYFTNLKYAADMLGAIAEKEVQGLPREPEETAFIKSLVQHEGMCGGPLFSGWYSDLFFQANEMTFEFKPTIADVHTDPNSSYVLHVGTGQANLMVLVADTSCGLKAYAGPASSYFELLEPGLNRLTDEDWKEMLVTDQRPPRPNWTEAFVVD
ncbi:MAG: DUF3160 domain-containing protein [Deltaproteobacteria bacterium]|nr:DUF3160 domain-containing protein [Deltaproteobacteria bacterium]